MPFSWPPRDFSNPSGDSEGGGRALAILFTAGME